MKGVASAILGTGSKFMPLPSAHVHGTLDGTNEQSCIGRIHVLFVHRLHLYGL